MNIYISGSIAYDRIMDFPGRFADYILPDKIHILNVCFNVNGMSEKFGGTAGNIAYSLSLLRETPFIVATVGKDYHAYFDWLGKNNIPLDGIKIIHNEFTAGAYVTTDMADNQITGFNPGAMKYPSEFSFDLPDPGHCLVIIAPGNLQDMIKYADICRKKNVRYICDPGQSLSKWEGKNLRDWLEGSFMLISNDYELEIVMKMTGMDKGELMDLTEIIITTLGEKGSRISTRESDIEIPAVKVQKVADPTGAGDAYRAGLLKGIALNKHLTVAARMGAVAATYAVEQYGTQEHSFTYDEFLQRYRENFGEL